MLILSSSEFLFLNCLSWPLLKSFEKTGDAKSFSVTAFELGGVINNYFSLLRVLSSIEKSAYSSVWIFSCYFYTFSFVPVG